MTHKKLSVVLVALLSIATARAQSDSDRTTVYVDTVLGGFTIELLDDVAPNTVANFLNYIRDGDYDGTFFHRAIPDFVLQGGGFSLGSDGVLSEVTSDPPVNNEFRLSNIRGTVAMAKLGGNPNSATNQWFINLVDNSAILDAQNGGFTVFARVIGDGMDVVDAIVAQPIFDFGDTFTDTPTINYSQGDTVLRENFVNINSMTVIETTLTSTGTATPASVRTGASVLFTVTVTPGTNPASTGITVTADLTSIGGSTAQALFDDGTNGDVTAGDNVFSFLANVPSGVTSGDQSISVSVSDAISRSGTTSVALTVSAGQTFSITDRAAVSLSSEGASATPVFGYGHVEADDGMTPPAGLAMLRLRVGEVLVTEAAMSAALPIKRSRIYAEVDGSENAAVVINNPNDETASVSFFFTDSEGNDFGGGDFPIGANEQMIGLLDQAPFNGPSSLNGTLTLDASLTVSVIAVRVLVNEREEFLLTPLPIVDLDSPGSEDGILFPLFTANGGWSSQVVLVNPTDTTLTGTVEFKILGGGETAVTVDSVAGTSFNYSISPRSSQNMAVSNVSPSLTLGWVEVTPTGSSTPSGTTIISFSDGAVTLSEAGVPAVPAGNAFRLYSEVSGDFFAGELGAIQTFLSIANVSSDTATITIQPYGLDGTSVGLTGTLLLPENGQAAVFLNQVPGLEALPIPFLGVLRVLSTTSISVTGVQARFNERFEFLFTATGPVDETAPEITSDVFFPFLADGGGWSSEFVLFSGAEGQDSSGRLRFIDSNGDALDLSVSSTSPQTTP